MTRIVTIDIHLVQIGPAVTPQPSPFCGKIEASQSKLTDSGHAVAIKGDRIVNTNPHVPVGGAFVSPPTDDGRIVNAGQSKFNVGGSPLATTGGAFERCDDIAPRSPVASAAVGKFGKLRIASLPCLLTGS